jgi:hypothetical protein
MANASLLVVTGIYVCKKGARMGALLIVCAAPGLLLPLQRAALELVG